SGVSASEPLARQAGLGNVVATDMGGTSFDIGLVPADGVKHYDFMPVIDRWLVSVPMIHLVTLGAGGGSIAGYDRLHQSVKVGPRSAGSDPGPACYDRGGLRPPVTAPRLLPGHRPADPTTDRQAPPYSSVFSALGAGNMPQLHIHERSVPLVLFDATSRAMFTDFGRFNAIVAELEGKGRADLQRQGLPGAAVRHRLELDMRYGN